MKLKFISVLLLSILMISCQSEFPKDFNINMTNSSKLTVKLVENNGNPIANTTVYIYDKASISSSSSSYNSLNYLYSKSTDANGFIDFGDVTSGTYYVIVNAVKVNGYVYHPMMQFQITGSKEKAITLNVEEFALTVNLNIKKAETVKSSNTVTLSSFSNLNVIFVPYSGASYSDLDVLISKAEAKGKTDASGVVSLKVPSYIEYKAYVYNDEKSQFAELGNSGSYSASTFTGDKGDNLSRTYTIDPSTYQTVYFGTYKLTVKKPVLLPTNTSPTLEAFEGLNIAAISESQYQSGIPLSVLLQNAELNGKTDANGVVTFSLRTNINSSNYFYLIAYNDQMTKYSVVPQTPFYLSTGETKQNTTTIDSYSLLSVTYNKINVTINKTASTYYTANPTDLTPFSNLKVALIPYSNNNSGATIDNLLSQTIASGTTNAAGQISFSIPVSSSYGSTYYQIVACDDAKTKKFVSASLSLYSGNTSTLNYNLNATTYASVN